MAEFNKVVRPDVCLAADARLAVERLLVDCDHDTVVLLVRRLGQGNVCHTGERTCFTRTVELAAGRAAEASAP